MEELDWKHSAVDTGHLVLAIALAVSPWILGFASDQFAALNAWISGAVIAVVAIVALAKFAEWEEWVNLALGLWVAVSPWVLGFSGHGTPLWTHVVIGLIVAILAAATLWQNHRTPPHAAAGQ